MPADFLLYQIGSNNWQIGEEYAPGSGILHEAHHVTYNNLPGTRSYSLFPSQTYDSHPDPTVKVFKIDHMIPIAEGSSPVSNYRWHQFSEEQFAKYRQKITDAVYEHIEKAEETEGKSFDLFIGHHTFLNPLILKDVNERRKVNGKSPVPIACFVHGTVLKMYDHEIAGENPQEYPKRFITLMQNEKVFTDPETGVKICFTISEHQKGHFGEIFPDFPGKVVISPNGINQLIFNPKTDPLDLNVWNGTGKPVPDQKIPFGEFSHLVAFVGKFADWKRIEALIYAAKFYEEKVANVGTVIVGKGPEDAENALMKLRDDLGVKNVYFAGPKDQKVLAKLYSKASVGVFPSKNEPFGMVFIECMACGTPVIGANSGGPKDFVTAEVGTLVEETDDLEELGKRIGNAVETALNNKWKETKGPGCNRIAVEKYSVKKQVTELIQEVKSSL